MPTLFIWVSLPSSDAFNGDNLLSNLHLVQQLETRRVLGLVELEDNVANLRFQL